MSELFGCRSGAGDGDVDDDAERDETVVSVWVRVSSEVWLSSDVGFLGAGEYGSICHGKDWRKIRE